MKTGILVVSCIALFGFGKARASFSADTIPVYKTSVLPGYSELLKKSRRQQTAGWILLGTGAGMCIVGGYIALYEILTLFTPAEKDKTPAIDVLMYGGIGLILLSIPFIVSGFKNRRKAKLFMKKEPSGISIGKGQNSSLTSFGIRVNF